MYPYLCAHTKLIPKSSFDSSDHIPHRFRILHQTRSNTFLTCPCLWTSTIQVHSINIRVHHLCCPRQRHCILGCELYDEWSVVRIGREVSIPRCMRTSELFGY